MKQTNHIWVIEGLNLSKKWIVEDSQPTRKDAREEAESFRRSFPGDRFRVVKYIRWDAPINVMYKGDIKWDGEL